MATTITSKTFEDGYYIPTYRIGSIKGTTDKTSITAKLSCEQGLNGNIETFFSTTLYAFSGNVELADVGRLIEEYFRLRNYASSTITIEFDDVSMDIHCIYCECDLGVDFYPQKSLFSMLDVQRVHADSAITFACRNTGSNNFAVKMVGHKADGSLGVLEGTFTRTFTRESATISVSSVIAYATNSSNYEVGDDELVDVLYFSVSYGDLQKVYYIMKDPEYLTFNFTNMFNIPEYLDVVGKVKTKTEVSRDTAVCLGVSVQYNQETTRSYEVETAPMTDAEARSFFQLLASRDIYIVANGDEFQVLVTDLTCEHSNDPDSLPTVKFTWRFADRRPALFGGDIAAMLYTKGNIFTEQYSIEFD